MVRWCHLLRAVSAVLHNNQTKVLQFLFLCSLSGLSPFMGDNDNETFANITRAEYDFDDEAFDTVSKDARDFIAALLIKRKE